VRKDRAKGTKKGEKAMKDRHERDGKNIPRITLMVTALFNCNKTKLT